jgi:aryl-alcohol dehydrogenase-like predicted oxidoreductase
MRTIRLGGTGLRATGVSFGALPIQRVSRDEAVRIFRRAFDAGVTFYDTARAYSDSEEKMGAAFAGLRDKILIATKSKGETGAAVTKDLETSLASLKTDYIDVFQMHNPSVVPAPGDGTGRYEALLEAKRAGKIRHIGLTNHRVERAEQAADSGLYEVIQYPFSILSSPREEEFTRRCGDRDVGFIAMKALSGGLVRHVPAAYSFMRRFGNVVPIWGIQRMEELEEFLALEANPPAWDATMRALVEEERNALGKDFCRGCGYCLPCPADIPIPMLARMRLFLTRGPWRREVSPEARAKYATADGCINCGECASRCPYELDSAALVKEHYAYYKAFVAEKQAAGEI